MTQFDAHKDLFEGQLSSMFSTDLDELIEKGVLELQIKDKD